MKSNKTGTPHANARLHQKQLKHLETATLEKKAALQIGVADVESATAKPAPGILSPDAYAAMTKAEGSTLVPSPILRGGGTVNSLMQVVELRSRPITPPQTAGAKCTLLGIDVASLGTQTAKILTPKITALALAMMLFSGSISEAPAQTVFVNVNGAKATQAEVMGAKRAATAVGEPFIMVRPGELAGVLEKASAPDGKLRKLVVSGHSSGLWISGSDDAGSHSLSLDDMQKHAVAFPEAFAKVQSFFAMACNVGTEENSRQWMALFPKANAVVGFDNIGPASDKPAAGSVLTLVDAELQKVNWKTLTRDGAMQLAKRLSNLPGVNVTEFAIRLKANDGSSVYFSKKNRPTSLSTASDLVDQLRTNGFTSYFEAKDARFARPPTEHGTSNPIRGFYNATQNLLNAMGRDIVARGGDPATDDQYQRIAGEKEAALRLIYFNTVLQNAEFHMRAQIDSVVKELGEHKIPIEIPKLTRMTRTEIIAVQEKLTELGNYTWSEFAQKHASDIAAVNAFAAQQPTGTIALSDVNPKLGDWHLKMILEGLDGVLANAGASAEVKEAAERLKTALSTSPSEAFGAVLRLFENGLVKLRVDAFPADWVTTDRPNV